ncbi:hypothetical protein JT141_07535 [Helicobacter pylori]|nr:hypothetical protein [Helicobacter pylori]
MNTARYNTISHLFFKKGVEMAFYHSIILSFYHSIILSFYHSIILSFYHSIIQSFKQSSNATLFLSLFILLQKIA